MCQIPVTECVSESQNDFSNLNAENITDRDTNISNPPGLNTIFVSDWSPSQSLDRLNLYPGFWTFVKKSLVEVSLSHYEKILAFARSLENKTWLACQILSHSLRLVFSFI